jgi:hypothetical protein
MKRRAVVSGLSDRVLVSSWSITDQGFKVQGDWIETSAEPVSDSTLGSMVRAALSNCQAGVPHPNLREGPTAERCKFLKLAHAKSESQYARGTREVSVRSEDPDSDLVVTPYRNGGRGTGFTEMLDQVITVNSGVDDAALGAAIRRALSVATDGK